MRPLLALVLIGCSPPPRWTPPTPPSAPSTLYIRAPFDDAWRAAVQYFADTRVPIGTIEKASGLIASKDFVLTLAALRQWADCGTVAGKRYVDVIYEGFITGIADFNVFLQPAGDSTALRVNVGVRTRLNQQSATMLRDRPNLCETNGVFERDLIAYIRANAKS